MSNCPGTVTWFKDPNRQDLICTLPTAAGKTTFTVGKLNATTLYYYNCQLKHGTICQSVGTAKIKGSSGSRETDGSILAAPTTPTPRVSSSNVGANMRIASTVIEEECSNSVSLATAMAYEYQILICQLLELAKGTDGEISEKEAEDVLSQIKSAASIGYAQYDIKFPADDSEIRQAIINKNCEIAGQLLAAPNNGVEIAKDGFGESKEKVHNETLNGAIALLASPLDMPITTMDPTSNADEYEFIGETGNLVIGSLPSGNCTPYSSSQDYAFCSNDKPNILKAKQLDSVLLTYKNFNFLYLCF